MKSFMRKTGAAALGLFLCVLLLELGLRAGGFLFLSFQEYKNASSARQKIDYRILCLGESTTANTWPSVLERILNEKNTGIKFSVIDKGRTGTNTRVILSEVESYLDKYHPDAVVAMMGINDEGVRYYQDIPEANTWMFRHCQVYKFGRILYMHLLKKIHREDIYGLDPGSKTQREYPEVVDEKNNFSTSERNDSDAHSMNSVHPVACENVDTGTAAAGPAAGAEITDKNSDKEIEKCYSEAIQKHPKDQMLYLNLATFYESRLMYDEAEKTHLSGMQVNPKDYKGYFALGLMYEHIGKNNKAEEIYKKVLEANNKNMRGYYGLSSLYCRQGRYDKSEETLKKGIAAEPGEGTLYSSLAFVYKKQNKNELAREYFSKADRARTRSMNPQTRLSYQKLKEILSRRNIKLILAQYPLRSVKHLKGIVGDDAGVIYVDNEFIFKKALETSKYEDYFTDRFAGDFGHCTPKGYELLANNIAEAILKDVF